MSLNFSSLVLFLIDILEEDGEIVFILGLYWILSLLFDVDFIISVPLTVIGMLLDLLVFNDDLLLFLNVFSIFIYNFDSSSFSLALKLYFNNLVYWLNMEYFIISFDKSSIISYIIKSSTFIN